MMQHINPLQFLCCVILTPPTQHLYLKEGGIVLSNCFRKWCLTGLEKVLAAAKKELD